MFGDRQDVESGLDDKTQRAFRAAEHAVEVETPVFLAQVRQVVTGQTAVKRWENILDQLCLRIGNLLRATINVAGAVDACLLAGQLFDIQCMTVDVRTAQQHGR